MVFEGLSENVTKKRNNNRIYIKNECTHNAHTSLSLWNAIYARIRRFFVILSYQVSY